MIKKLKVLMNPIKIFPSLISSNILRLEKTIVELEPACDGFHIDIMDNHFVPNLTWGPSIVNQIAHHTNKPLSIHLMVNNPEKIIKQLILKEGSTVSFHIENGVPEEIIATITDKKLHVSAAIKPETPLETLYPYMHNFQQILLMSVEPGFSGQKFLPQSLEKLKKLVDYKQANSLTYEIAMDGGIDEKNIHQLYKFGATTFCIASAIFKTQKPLEALKKLYAIALEG